MIYASRVEGLADPRGALELDCPDVVYGHTGFGHTEERGHALDEVVGHLDAHGMDTGRSHGELQSAGCCVVFPHLHIRGVFDAVDRHAVDSPTVDGVSSIVIVCERHTGDGGADRHGELAIISDITGHIGGVAIEVEGCHSILVACGVDELDAGGGDDRLALVVFLGVGLGHVHETGGLVHDETLAHLRIGVVLGGEPFGQLRAGDVSANPSHIVVRLRVNLEEHCMRGGLREHGLPVVRHSVAIVICPERIKRALGELVAVDDVGGHGEHVRAGHLITLADVLGIRVGADITLDAGDGLSLIDLDGL